MTENEGRQPIPFYVYDIHKRIVQILAKGADATGQESRCVYHLMTALRGPDPQGPIEIDLAKLQFTHPLRTFALGPLMNSAWSDSFLQLMEKDQIVLNDAYIEGQRKALERLYTDSRFINLPGASHWLSHMTLAWHAAAVLLSFSNEPL